MTFVWPAGRAHCAWGGHSVAFTVWVDDRLLLILINVLAGLPEAGFLFGFVEGLEGAGGCGCGGFAPLFFGAFDVVAGQELEGQLAVGFGSAGFGVVEGDGLAVAGGFGQADIAGNGGFEELVVEEGFEIFVRPAGRGWCGRRTW